MAEFGDLDARLERKKRIKLRRQQREMKREHLELEALEKERRKLAMRCEEMAKEEQLSIAMMKYYRQEEKRRQREAQREKDMALYDQVASVRRRAKKLGLELKTEGMVGEERLHALEQRVLTRETALKVAEEAKQRLDAMPKKRSRVRRLIESYFSTSHVQNIESAVYEQRCEAIVELLEPGIPGKRTSSSLLNHESKNGLTPVLCAIFQRKLPLLRRLLELGASPDFETKAAMTPLLACVMTDDVVAISILMEFKVKLEHETSGGVTPLLLCADKARDSALQYLLANGVNVNSTNGLGRSALMQATIAGHYHTVKVLLAHDADRKMLDKTGLSAFDFAKKYAYDHIASLLNSTTRPSDLMVSIQECKEAEADAPGPLAKRAVKELSKLPGTLAMEAALRDGNVDRILELLSVNDIGYGPNFETNAGEMPLLVVAKLGKVDQLISCLAFKCIAIQTNRFGQNAMMKAAYHGDSTMLKVLCEAGCSFTSRDFRGQDAFKYMHDNEHTDQMASFLKQAQQTSLDRLRIGEPLSNVSSLRGLLRQQSVQRPSRLDSSTEEDSNSADEDESLSSGDNEKVREGERRHKWSIRRNVLRHNRKRNEAFEVEREKIRKYGMRDRRNGLIAPLPFDSKGRLKFPPCDNCQGNRARKRCFACDQVLCDRCHTRLHDLPHRKHHEYEEIEPTLMVGAKAVDTVIQNQDESLQGSVDRSMAVIEKMKAALDVSIKVTPTEDPEVEKFERRERILREKEIAQMQINVPVAAAKHAQRGGEGQIYTNPSDIELADLYILQGKFAKARTVMEEAKQFVETSLGYADPTMLKIFIRLAKIEQQTGDLNKSLEVLANALGTFESTLSSDTKDLLVAQDMILNVLDSLGLYNDAVHTCRRLIQQRVISLGTTHLIVQQARHRHDEFVAKREKFNMHQEDLLSLERLALNAEQAEQLRAEQERQLQSFRSLLLDQTPVETFDEFLRYAKKEFAEDMVQFWIAVEKAKLTIGEDDAKAFRAAVVAIFLLYIKSRRIKIITAVQRKKMKKAITTPGKKISRTIFDEVQALVFDVIYNRVHRRFRDEGA